MACVPPTRYGLLTPSHGVLFDATLPLWAQRCTSSLLSAQEARMELTDSILLTGQAGLKLSIVLLHLPSAGITGTHHHTQLRK
jgi:hypothetical protein